MAKKNISKKGKSNNKASKSRKKQVKKSAKKVQKQKLSGKTILLILIAVAVIAAVALNWDKINDKSSKEQIAASVNDEIITVSDIEYVYNRLPAQTRTFVTKEKLLDQMINEKLLVQAAEKKDIEVTEQEVEDFLDSLILQSGLSKEEFEQRISDQNISMDTLREEVYKQLIITELYQQEILDNTEVSDEEIKAYYNENIDSYEVGEQVKASHILICHNESPVCDSNLTKEEALNKTQEILASVNDTNFEDLAMEFSMGPSAPNGGDLGYFGKGIMVKQFEDAAFALEVAEVSDVVETSFGYHIIKVFEKSDKSTKPLEEVSAEIGQTLLAQTQQDTFKEYLEGLKESSTIINFYEERVVATTQ